MKRLCLLIAFLFAAGFGLWPAMSEGAADTFLPWEGGAEYYRRWLNGPPPDPGFFPISVWYQRPSNAARYKAIGVNQYVGPIDPDSGEGLELLGHAGMPLFGLRSVAVPAGADPRILRGWFLFDEPDNAQEKPGGGYGPCLSPDSTLQGYKEIRAADPTRPVLLNLGQAVANEGWIGRGEACAGHWEQYPRYAEAADIVAFDVYPVNERLPLWWVGKGVDRLREWARCRKPVWNWIETAAYDGGPKPAPADIKAEVWMSIIHGSMGIGYFCHRFKPTLNDAAPLDDPSIRQALAAINAQIRELAPVLNTPSVANGVSVTSSRADVPVDHMLKRYAGATYLFAVGARPAGPVHATFKLRDCPAAVTATVLGEGRMLPVKEGRLADTFDSYQVHLYRVPFVPAGQPARPDRR